MPTLIFLFQLHAHRMLSALGEINKGLVHVPAMWGGMWEAHSLRTQAPQLQSRLDVNFKTQVEEWRRKDDAAVRMQSCFRGRRVRRVAALRVPPEARDVVPPAPPDPPAPSPPPSGSPSEPAASTAAVRAVDGLTLTLPLP